MRWRTAGHLEGRNAVEDPRSGLTYRPTGWFGSESEICNGHGRRPEVEYITGMNCRRCIVSHSSATCSRFCTSGNDEYRWWMLASSLAERGVMWRVAVASLLVCRPGNMRRNLASAPVFGAALSHGRAARTERGSKRRPLSREPQPGERDAGVRALPAQPQRAGRLSRGTGAHHQTVLRGAFPISRSRAHTHRRHGHPLQTVPSAGLIERPQEKNRVDALR